MELNSFFTLKALVSAELNIDYRKLLELIEKRMAIELQYHQPILDVGTLHEKMTKSYAECSTSTQNSVILYAIKRWNEQKASLEAAKEEAICMLLAEAIDDFGFSPNEVIRIFGFKRVDRIHKRVEAGRKLRKIV